MGKTVDVRVGRGTGDLGGTVKVDLYSPETYVDGPPHALFARLRRERPVLWQEIPGQAGYWAVLRHADVVRVSRNPSLFACEPGGVVLEDLDPERLARMRDMLLSMDPPRHLAYRKPLAPEFAQRVIANMDGQIRQITNSIFDRAAESGEVEFVHDVVGPIPTQVIGRLFGLPESDWDWLHRLAQMNTSGQDPDLNPDGDLSEAGSADSSLQMAMYGIEFARSRRAMEPQGDLMDVILGQEFDGRFLTDGDIGSLLVQMITAGNDTTVSMMAGGLWALLEHPAELSRLRSDPSLLPAAIEEILRWFTPLHYFRRTATEDTELGGQTIAKGDKIAMYYTSANRDEEVFDDADVFDIGRSPNPQLAFGIGEHFCLGVHLARLEGRIFFDELLRRFSRMELVGTPERVRSNLNNGVKRLPVSLVV